MARETYKTRAEVAGALPPGVKPKWPKKKPVKKPKKIRSNNEYLRRDMKAEP